MEDRCVGCGGKFEVSDGPVHPYMLASAGCWNHYGQVLACEYSDRALFGASHRLTVDAYALQHPGKRDDRRAIQSVRIHFVSLYLIFEHQVSHTEATKMLKSLAGGNFDPLPTAPNDFAITAQNLSAAGDATHLAQVNAWAQCAYDAWIALRPYAQTVVAGL